VLFAQAARNRVWLSIPDVSGSLYFRILGKAGQRKMPKNLDMLNQNTGKRLVELARIVMLDKHVPWFHRAPVYMAIVFAVLAACLPIGFLLSSQPGYAFASLCLMGFLLLVSIVGIFWTIFTYSTKPSGRPEQRQAIGASAPGQSTRSGTGTRRLESRSVAPFPAVSTPESPGAESGQVGVLTEQERDATRQEHVVTGNETGIDLGDIRPLDPSDVRRARKFRSYDSDVPPEVIVWAGRNDELALMSAIDQGVIAVTGIGGQGKSSLAAKALEQWREQHRDEFFDWRDCREQGDRFPTQLAALISRLTFDNVDASALAEASALDVSRLFFRLVRESRGMAVFDNVDHYVDAESSVLSGAIGVFIQEALRSRTRFKIVLTCRPRLSYADVTFREVPLIGLSEHETIELFRLRKISPAAASDAQIREIHRLTRGHPFWLTVLTSELERRPHIIDAMIEQLHKGQGENNKIAAMLRPVWGTITARERIVLQFLGECTKPLTEDLVDEVLREKIGSAGQVRRALRATVASGLVSRKSSQGQPTLYELHPVVRGFLCTEFGLNERKPFIRLIADGTRSYIGRVRQSRGHTMLSIENFEFAALNIEADLHSGYVKEAAASAASISEAFSAKGILLEYVRLASEILAALDMSELDKDGAEPLHAFIMDLIEMYVESGRESDARQLIKVYIPHRAKDTRSRILWEAKSCRIEWLLGNYEEAIRHGREGVAQKELSKIDTLVQADTTLHLALRDSGQVDEALKFFTRGADLDELLKLRRDDPHDHSFYGNIGRCLYLKGDVKRAIRFYALAWSKLLGDESATASENRGWAGLWLGEAYIDLSQFQLAAAFLAHARDTWSRRLPLKLGKIETAARRLSNGAVLPESAAADLTRAKCDREMKSIL